MCAYMHIWAICLYMCRKRLEEHMSKLHPWLSFQGWLWRVIGTSFIIQKRVVGKVILILIYLNSVDTLPFQNHTSCKMDIHRAAHWHKAYTLLFKGLLHEAHLDECYKWVFYRILFLFIALCLPLVTVELGNTGLWFLKQTKWNS